jgi:hypothetical protein
MNKDYKEFEYSIAVLSIVLLSLYDKQGESTKMSINCMLPLRFVNQVYLWSNITGLFA